MLTNLRNTINIIKPTVITIKPTVITILPRTVNNRMYTFWPKISCLLHTNTFWFSSSITSNQQILASPFHIKGLPVFHSPLPKNIRPELLQRIHQLQKQLNHTRQLIINTPLPQQTNLWHTYNQQFQLLRKALLRCDLSSIWAQDHVLWYNMTALYLPTLQALLPKHISKTAPFIQRLKNRGVSTIAVSQPAQRSLLRKIPIDVQLQLYRKITQLLVCPLTLVQRKFLQRYLAHNLQQFLKEVGAQDETAIDNMLWLLRFAVDNMIDEEMLIGKFQKSILTSSLHLQPKHLQTLMHIYARKGKMHPLIETLFLQPHLKTLLPQASFEQLVDILEFLVLSQSQNQQMRSSVLSMLAKKYRKVEEHSRQSLQKLQLYAHFFQVVLQQQILPKKMGNEVKALGKQHQNMLQQIAWINYNKKNTKINEKGKTNNQKNTKKSNQPQTSRKGVMIKNNKQIDKKKSQTQKQLLQKTKEIDLTSKVQQLPQLIQSQKQQFVRKYGRTCPAINFDRATIYPKVQLWGIQLTYCLRNLQTEELTNFRQSSLGEVFSSGRCLRRLQVGEQVLEHYGIRTINYNQHLVITKAQVGKDKFSLN